MIRRPSPLGSATPNEWLLIPQREHARLSYSLAGAWGNDAVGSLFDEERVRSEFLAALLHHDDGWDAWWDDPGIDPERGRPYSFTEMPPEDAQRLWSASIEVCREFGPLAGWVVATHFSALQSKRDEDWAQWRPWIEAVDAERAVWLAEWRDTDDSLTIDLAQRALRLLQAFDWMSLWLSCKCPTNLDNAMPADLEVGGEGADWPTIRLRSSLGGESVDVEPWPFSDDALDLAVDARIVPADSRYASGRELKAAAKPVRLIWRLRPGG